MNQLGQLNNLAPSDKIKLTKCSNLVRIKVTGLKQRIGMA